MKKLTLAVLMTAALWLVIPATASAQTQYVTGNTTVVITGCEPGQTACAITVNPMPAANNCLNGAIYVVLDGTQGTSAMYATALMANATGMNLWITFTQAGGPGTTCSAVYVAMSS